MKIKNLKLFIVCSFVLVFPVKSFSTYFPLSTASITNYRPIFTPYYDKNNGLRIAIREYLRDNKPFFLLVNPQTFSTEIASASHFRKAITNSNAGFYVLEEIRNTPYGKALLRYTEPPYRLQNYGITHAEHPVSGVFLTIDMCPSRKLFEKSFFTQLVTQSQETHRAVPIAISITGLWVNKHVEEFNWLIQQEKSHTLQITWINHSFHHPYRPTIPLEENFLLTPSTNVDREILDTEKLLIKNGQVPSVFFRFPGLVANKYLVLKLRQFGLIPIGSNAWLAKGQTAVPGSIILVHGNGNGPLGIRLFMQRRNKLPLLPLNQAFASS